MISLKDFTKAVAKVWLLESKTSPGNFNMKMLLVVFFAIFVFILMQFDVKLEVGKWFIRVSNNIPNLWLLIFILAAAFCFITLVVFHLAGIIDLNKNKWLNK